MTGGCQQHDCQQCGGSATDCPADSYCNGKSPGDGCQFDTFAHDVVCFLVDYDAMDGYCDPPAVQICFKYRMCTCQGSPGALSCSSAGNPDKEAKNNHSHGPC